MRVYCIVLWVKSYLQDSFLAYDQTVRYKVSYKICDNLTLDNN